MSRLVLRAAIIGLGIVALVVVLEVVTSGHGKPQARTAPGLPGEVLVGPRVGVDSLRGKPVAVTFWASWCQPCEGEAPALERFATSPAGRGRLIGVDWADARAGAQGFVQRFGWTFPNLRDAGGTVGNSYGLAGLPTTFVLDPNGRIVASLTGPQTEASLEAALSAASG